MIMYKQIAIPFFFLVVIAFTGYMIYRMSKKNNSGHSKKRTFITLLFLWYLCAVAAITVIPIRASRTQNLDHHFNFTPVINSYKRFVYVEETKDVHGIRNFRGNLIGNILMFIPLGIFLSLLYRKRFLNVVMIAALSSCLIEFLQYLNMFMGYYRYVDVDDVILNTLGGVIGFCIVRIGPSRFSLK